MPNVAPIELLILFASIGSGHEMAAAAVAEQARAIGGERLAVRQVDLLSLARFAGKRRLSAVPSVPGVGAVYDAIWGAEWLGGPVGGLARLTQPLLFPGFAEQLTPATRIVVSTHALGAQLSAGLPRVRRVSAMTDLMPHAFWPRDLDVLCASTPEARDVLARRGFRAEQLAVTGIPVRSQFATLPDRTEARACLGLGPERPVALVVAGAEDPGPYSRMAPRLSAVIGSLLEAGLMPLVLTGTDAELLERVRAQFADRVVALPFTDDMATPMAASDVVVAKPGGSLIAECLACGKPLVLLARGRGQERANSEYLEAARAAVIAEDDAQLREKLGGLAADAGALRAMAERAKALGRPNAARRVAALALAGFVENGGGTIGSACGPHGC